MLIDPEYSKSIFLFPHQDDEYFVAPFIKKNKDSCFCFFLTKGEGKGIPESIRNQESAEVLQKLGVKEEYIHFLPKSLDVADLDLMNKLETVFEWILQSVHDNSIHRIFCPAYEGGHPDHDAAFFLGIALGKHFHSEVCHYPTYTGNKLPYPMYRVMIPYNSKQSIKEALGFRERLFYAFLFRFYPSQWRTWLLLAPEAIVSLLIRGYFSVSKDSSSFLKISSDIPYYEKRGLCKRNEFLNSISEFCKEHTL
ncbi:MAG: PIG-L family deacetylase [Leptospiraceae bacterium]|nr:PIG-L family deacetylase [Leptospiraceae bacterium]